MVDQVRVFSGRAAIADLPRLAKVVLGAEGDIELQLEFKRDQEKRACVSGSVKADLLLECQRCLNPMLVPIESQLNIALVKSVEEAERLPEYYDPLLLDEPRIRLLDIVEEELLLSMPQVSRHETGECSSDLCQEAEQSIAGREEPGERSNPFAILAELKQK
jgi:uncharacterized protein